MCVLPTWHPKSFSLDWVISTCSEAPHDLVPASLFDSISLFPHLAHTVQSTDLSFLFLDCDTVSFSSGYVEVGWDHRTLFAWTLLGSVPSFHFHTQGPVHVCSLDTLLIQSSTPHPISILLWYSRIFVSYFSIPSLFWMKAWWKQRTWLSFSSLYLAQNKYSLDIFWMKKGIFEF